MGFGSPLDVMSHWGGGESLGLPSGARAQPPVFLGAAKATGTGGLGHAGSRDQTPVHQFPSCRYGKGKATRVPPPPTPWLLLFAHHHHFGQTSAQRQQQILPMASSSDTSQHAQRRRTAAFILLFRPHFVFRRGQALGWHRTGTRAVLAVLRPRICSPQRTASEAIVTLSCKLLPVSDCPASAFSNNSVPETSEKNKNNKKQNYSVKKM